MSAFVDGEFRACVRIKSISFLDIHQYSDISKSTFSLFVLYLFVFILFVLLEEISASLCHKQIDLFHMNRITTAKTGPFNSVRTFHIWISSLAQRQTETRLEKLRFYILPINLRLHDNWRWNSIYAHKYLKRISFEIIKSMAI